jgi:maltose/moltooligosaccharide transporter
MSVALDPAPQKVAKRTILAYATGNIGANAVFALNSFILPLFLAPLGASLTLIGALTSARSAEGVIVAPLIGAWSDRTWTRIGRRRPFILVFLPLCAVLVATLPFVPAIGDLHVEVVGIQVNATLAIAAVLIILFTIAFNAMYDPYQALMPDLVPVERRGRVNGIFQLLGSIGLIGFLLLSSFQISFMVLALVAAAALILSYLPTLLAVRERRALAGSKGNGTDAESSPSAQERNEIRAALIRDPQLQRFYATQVFVSLGRNALTPFLTLFAIHAAHFSQPMALRLAFLSLLVTVVFVWPFGALGDRLGAKRLFFFGILLQAGTAVLTSVTREPLLLFVSFAVGGIGTAAQIGNGYPLLTRLAPTKRVGLFTGVDAALASITAPLAGVLMGSLLDAFGYDVLFPPVAALYFVALVPLALLRVGQSPGERERQGVPVGVAGAA